MVAATSEPTGGAAVGEHPTTTATTATTSAPYSWVVVRPPRRATATCDADLLRVDVDALYDDKRYRPLVRQVDGMPRFVD
jgi:hypothetical protein